MTAEPVVDLSWVKFAPHDEDLCGLKDDEGCTNVAAWRVIGEPCGHVKLSCHQHRYDIEEFVAWVLHRAEEVGFADGSPMFCGVCGVDVTGMRVEPLRPDVAAE